MRTSKGYFVKTNSPILIIGTLLLAGCQNIQPWERGILAKPEMQLEVSKLGGQLRQQVYFANEASTGGSGVAGAGCGCN